MKSITSKYLIHKNIYLGLLFCLKFDFVFLNIHKLVYANKILNCWPNSIQIFKKNVLFEALFLELFDAKCALHVIITTLHVLFIAKCHCQPNITQA